MPKGLIAGVFLILIISASLIRINRAEAGLANHAVINEVSIDSLVGAGGTDDDWVELYNPTDQAINLNDWSIQKTTGTGGSLVKVALSGQIPAEGYFLIVRNGSTTSQSLRDKADILASDSFSLASNNIVYLVNDNNNITNSSDPNIIDFVGWGTASFYEGSAPASAIAESKSIARVPDGEDTDQNSVDFVLLDNPTPMNSSISGGNNIGGTVILTITPDPVPVQNITPSGAQIVFQVNSAGTVLVKYGLNNNYGNATAPEAVGANTTKIVSLNGLTCGTTYHYAIYAEDENAIENDTTSDAIFTTLPCGITLETLTMTKATAKANNQYNDGWQWEFNITVWNINETSLKMKFDQWSGASTLAAAANMQYSVDNGTTWHDITANGAYPVAGADLSGIDNDVKAGRQVKIIVRMKVPVGTIVGYYNSNYGILTE
jgi:hypothetical protein